MDLPHQGRPQPDEDSGSPSRQNTVIAALTAWLFVVVLGMVTAYSSPACVDMQKPGSRFIDITAGQIAWIASLPPLAGMVGNALSGYISLKLGRRSVLMFASFPYALSWLAIAYAPHVSAIYVGRLVSGFCAGICSVAIPAYVIEISPIEIRGLLLAGFQVAFSAGVLLVIGLGAVLRWSWLAVSGSVIVVCSAALMCAMPESPAWLVRESRYVEALSGLVFFKGRRQDALKELEEIIHHHSTEPEDGLSARELLKPTLYKPMLIAVALSLFQQFSGVGALMSYSVELFQDTESFLDPSLAAVVVATVQLVAAGCSSFLMDRVGRRVLYMSSSACMTLSLTFNGVHALMSRTEELAAWNWAPLLCYVVYIAAFALGVGAIPFVVVPEMVPTHSRSFLLAVASVFISLFGFLVTRTFDDLRSVLGLAGLYWTYATFTLFGFLFYWTFIPETKGRTIRDINSSFSEIGES